MRLIINLILIALIGALGYLLFYGIQEPISFGDAKKERVGAVTDRMKQIRYAQEFYRDITGRFAGSFDSLKYVLTNDSFTLVKLLVILMILQVQISKEQRKNDRQKILLQLYLLIQIVKLKSF